MPEVRAADAALGRVTDKPASNYGCAGSLKKSIRILSVVRPVADLSPSPRLLDDQISEIIWKINPYDLSALSQVLDLKSESGSNVTVDVLMPGGSEHDYLLREAAGVKADRLYRLNTDPSAGAEIYIKNVKELEDVQHYDLITMGAHCLSGNQGLAAFLAGSLKKHFYQKKRIKVNLNNRGLEQVVLPAVIAINSADQLPDVNASTMVASAFSSITIIQPAPRDIAVLRTTFELPASTNSVKNTVATISQVSEYLKTYAAQARIITADKYLEIPTVKKNLAQSNAVWAILDTSGRKTNLAVIHSCTNTADILKKEANAVIAAPKKRWQEILALAKSAGCDHAFCVDTKNGRLSDQGKQALIRIITKAFSKTIIMAGVEWTSSLAYSAGEVDTREKNTILRRSHRDCKIRYRRPLTCFSRI